MDKICTYCGKEGHRAHACPVTRKLPLPPPPLESPPVCPWCEHQGADGCQHAGEVSTCPYANN